MPKVLIPLALAACLSAGGLALAQPQPQPSAPPPASTPAPAAKGDVDPAVTLMQGHCVSCHDVGFIMQGHHTAKEWRDLVGQMMDRGADVNEAEADQIAAYLAKTLPAPQ